MMAWYVEFHDRVRLCRFPTERTEQTATPKGVRARSTACINGERLDSRLTCFQMQIALKIILKKWFFFIVQDLRKKNPWLMFPSFSLMDTWNAIQFWQFVQLRIVMLSYFTCTYNDVPTTHAYIQWQNIFNEHTCIIYFLALSFTCWDFYSPFEQTKY